MFFGSIPRAFFIRATLHVYDGFFNFDLLRHLSLLGSHKLIFYHLSLYSQIFDTVSLVDYI